MTVTIQYSFCTTLSKHAFFSSLPVVHGEQQTTHYDLTFTRSWFRQRVQPDSRKSELGLSQSAEQVHAAPLVEASRNCQHFKNH